MRQLSIIFLLVIYLTLLTTSCGVCAVKGGIEYTIPTDYSKISESELAEKAKVYYFNALKYKDKNKHEDITNALMLYSILLKINPDNSDYAVKQGVLYDKLGKDRYAKGCFSRVIGTNSEYAEAYFYFGEFYYSRAMYRKALKYYSEAYKHGMKTDYDLLLRMGDIYEKFGDTRSALKYMRSASEQSPNAELDNKIRKLEAIDSSNKEYYSNTRIHTPNQ